MSPDSDRTPSPEPPAAPARPRRAAHQAGSRRLALLLAVMVLLPLAAVAWVGARLVTDQAALARHEVDLVFGDRLAALDRAIGGIVKGLERELGRYEDALPDDAPLDPDRMRDALRRFPREIDALVLDREGRVAFPPIGGAMSDHERAFLERTRPIWEGGILLSLAVRSPPSAPAGLERGWLAFFAGGAQHFLWWHFDGRRVVALETPNILFLSELVMQLPDTPVEPLPGSPRPALALPEGRTELVDAAGSVVYQWGAYAPRPGEQPKAIRSLSEPLTAWSLRHYAPESNLPAQIAETLRGWLFGGLAALGAALGLGAWLVWRARTREMRLAGERVSFVNQVSHELKTPLTNIRMYTELLRDRLDAEDLLAPGEPIARHIDVLARETDRLSRMIKNVLSFSRGQEDKLKLSRRDASADDIARATLASFAPVLAQAKIAVETDLRAAARASLDPDVFEQVLANLVSNVEKYGRAGGLLRVETRTEGGLLHLVVSDRGPGIPPEFREKIFEPFWRMSDKTTDAATGTGIGLDIARRLARLHGGDLRLAPSDRGARFEATFALG